MTDELQSHLNWRHIPVYWDGEGNRIQHYCPSCQGSGIKVYGSTATWRGGIGGAAMTQDVCNKCWGSGDDKAPWPSHREFQDMKRTLEAK